MSASIKLLKLSEQFSGRPPPEQKLFSLMWVSLMLFLSFEPECKNLIKMIYWCDIGCSPYLDGLWLHFMTGHSRAKKTEVLQSWKGIRDSFHCKMFCLPFIWSQAWMGLWRTKVHNCLSVYSSWGWPITLNNSLEGWPNFSEYAKCIKVWIVGTLKQIWIRQGKLCWDDNQLL